MSLFCRPEYETWANVCTHCSPSTTPVPKKKVSRSKVLHLPDFLYVDLCDYKVQFFVGHHLRPALLLRLRNLVTGALAKEIVHLPESYIKTFFFVGDMYIDIYMSLTVCIFHSFFLFFSPFVSTAPLMWTLRGTMETCLEEMRAFCHAILCIYVHMSVARRKASLQPQHFLSCIYSWILQSLKIV